MQLRLRAVGWPLLVFSLVLILVIRPGLTLLSTAGGRFRTLDRVYWAWFGIRGVGSVYYLSYAINRGVDDALAPLLFVVVIGTILVSIVLHGFTVRPFMRRYEGEPDVEQ
jgi:sodium/hydrogen antiporter